MGKKKSLFLMEKATSGPSTSNPTKNIPPSRNRNYFEPFPIVELNLAKKDDQNNKRNRSVSTSSMTILDDENVKDGQNNKRKRSVSTSSRTILDDENVIDDQRNKRKRSVSTSSTTILDDENVKKMKTTKGQRVKNSNKKTENVVDKSDQIDDGVQEQNDVMEESFQDK